MAWVSERRPDWSRGDLLPVVVQDAADGTLLMLAWANEAAVSATEASGRAHFWSRSRDELWQKGATSGNELHVVDLAVDCDGDALRYRVRATGPACHTGARSCWDAPDAPDAGDAPDGVDAPRTRDAPESPVPAPRRFTLDALEAVIASRRSADPEASYTARLLAAGVRRPAEKVTEEAGELSAAALVGSDDEVRGEAADLLYHVLVLLGARRIALDEVLELLGERHRR